MKSLLRMFVVIAALAAVAGAGILARAGGVVIGDQSKKPAWQLPSKFRRALEEDDMRRQRPQEDIREVESKPMLDAAGRQLVGIVGKRTLTKPQLDQRVNLIVSRLPAAKDKNDELDRRIGLENRIVAEWEKAAALAMLAENSGFTATAQEVDQAIRDLSAKSEADPNQAVQQVRMIGISDAELRQEVADGIIVEKMIRDQIGRVRDEDMKEVFSRYPDAFLEPTRVKAWHLVAPLLNSPTADQLKDLQKQMAKYGKRLSKCRDEEDYKALQKELKDLGPNSGMVLTYSDDAQAKELSFLESPTRSELAKALMGLKPGKTSDVIASPPPPAKPTELHVVKVLERKEGHRGTFEEAKPQVQNFMAEKLKDLVYENMRSDEKYDIRTDPAGLNEYREIGRIPAKPQVKTAKPEPAATPRAALRTPFTPGRQVRTSAFGTAEPPPVESVVGSRAEPVAPGLAATSPARNLDPLTGRPLGSPIDAAGAPGSRSAAAGRLPEVGTEAAPAADAGGVGGVGAPAGLGTTDAGTAPEGLNAQAAPSAQEETGTPLPPSLRRTSTRRSRRPVKQHNYNVAPPSVEEAISRGNQ